MAKGQSAQAGIVYILTNPALEGLVKIGRVASQDPRAIKTRIGHLKAGSPYPYKCEGAARSADAKWAEHAIHELIDDGNGNEKVIGGGQEWFQMTVEKATKYLDAVKGLTRIPAYEMAAVFPVPAEPKVSHPGEAFTFIKLGIPLGAVLTFQTDERATCVVTSLAPPQVSYKGQEVTLNAASVLHTGKPGRGRWQWRYQGVPLHKLPLN